MDTDIKFLMEGTVLACVPSGLSDFSMTTDSGDSDKMTLCGDKTHTYKEEHVFVCSECSTIFTSVETCKEHVRKDHTVIGSENKTNTAEGVKGDNRLLKGEVNFDASERSVLMQDEKCERGNEKKSSQKEQLEQMKIFRCTKDSCGYGFSTGENRKYHLRCHLTNGKKFICPECEDSFTFWRTIVLHLWKVHEIDIDLHKCNVCNYRAHSMFKLKNHQLIHGDERRFLCVTCGKSFKQMSQLRNHSLIHKDKKDIPGKRWYSEQECSICFRKFADSKSLRKHVSEVHKKIKPYDCNYCDYSTSRKGMLLLHIRNHTGEKPYKCEFCEYCTADHNSLRRHRMRHTGERRYACPHCQYSSIQAISLKSHVMSKHPGKEGAYSCALCQFTSINKEIFESHVSDHNQGLIPGTSVNSNEGLIPGTSVNSNAPETSISVLPYQPIDITTTTKIEMEQPSASMKTAETVSKCLYALTQTDGVAQLPPGVTIIASKVENGVQTITIEIPSENGNFPQQFLLKIQPSSDEALHIMYQPVPEISSNVNELSTIKFTQEFVANTIKVPEISPNDTSPMGIIVNPDQIFLQEFRNIDQVVRKVFTNDDIKNIEN